MRVCWNVISANNRMHMFELEFIHTRTLWTVCALLESKICATAHLTVCLCALCTQSNTHTHKHTPTQTNQKERITRNKYASETRAICVCVCIWVCWFVLISAVRYAVICMLSIFTGLEGSSVTKTIVINCPIFVFINFWLLIDMATFCADNVAEHNAHWFA